MEMHLMTNIITAKIAPSACYIFSKNYLTPTGKYYDAQQNFHRTAAGTEFQYSNIGAALIGLLVQQISGVDFAEYTQKYIFKPLGMTNTHWHLRNIKNNIVTLYEDGNPLENYTFTDYPNGGLRSTAIDMHKFIITIGNYGRSFNQTNNSRILSQEIAAKMLKPQIPNIDKSVGLHIFYRGKQSLMWGHEGGEQGISTYVGINPNNGFGVILLANNSDVDLDEAIEVAYEAAVDQLNFGTD